MNQIAYRSGKFLAVALTVAALTVLVVYGFGIQNTLQDMMLSKHHMMMNEPM